MRTSRRAWRRIAVALGVVGAGGALAAEPGAPKLALHGLVYFENYSFLESAGPGMLGQRDELTARAKLEAALSDAVGMAAGLEMRRDAADESRSRTTLYEAYLDAFQPRWSAVVGRQFVTWGRADELRPTDVFRRRDFTDLVEGRDEPITALKLGVPLGSDASIEAVWEPVLEPDVLPLGPNNRWFPLPRTAPLPGGGAVALDYQLLNRAEPGSGIGASVVAARFTGQWGGWDFAAMFARAFDRIPTYLDVAQGAPSADGAKVPVALTPHHRPLYVWGGDFATVLGSFGVRGEATYTLTDDPSGIDPRVDDPYVRAMLGVDHTFIDVFRGVDLFVVAQYGLDMQVPRRAVLHQDSPEPLVRMRHFYRNGGFFQAELRFSEFTRAAMKAFVDLEHGDSLLQPEIRWQPRDGVSVVTGADIPGGPPGTFFGTYVHDWRVRARIEARF